jgi:hypothetical protein
MLDSRANSKGKHSTKILALQEHEFVGLEEGWDMTNLY